MVCPDASVTTTYKQTVPGMAVNYKGYTIVTTILPSLIVSPAPPPVINMDDLVTTPHFFGSLYQLVSLKPQQQRLLMQ